MFNLETRTGEPIAAGTMRLVPIARSMRLDLGRGALVWRRAVGVSVQSVGDGGSRSTATEVPIRDLTRHLQLAILGAGLVGALLLKLAGRRRGRHAR